MLLKLSFMRLDITLENELFSSTLYSSGAMSVHENMLWKVSSPCTVTVVTKFITA